MVEHLTADQEVPGSNPGAPCSVANFGNIKFSTSKQGWYFFVKLIYLISFLWMKTRSSEKVVTSFSPLNMVDFGKTKVLTSK